MADTPVNAEPLLLAEPLDGGRALPVVPGPVNGATPATPGGPEPVVTVPTPALPGAPAVVTVMPAPPLVGPLLRDRPVLPISFGLKKVAPDLVLSRGAPVVGSMQWV